MKKIIALILTIVIIAILFIPIPSDVAKDGGTKSYSSLTYKIVVWNKFSNSYKPYKNTSIYFIPYNFYSLDALWKKEKEKLDGEEFGDYSFTTTITEKWGEDSFLIKNGDTVLSNSDKPIVLKNGNTASFSDLKVGDKIKITYDGCILETYPSMLNKVYEIEILE